jgi:hypothetical protein
MHYGLKACKNAVQINLPNSLRIGAIIALMMLAKATQTIDLA